MTEMSSHLYVNDNVCFIIPNVGKFFSAFDPSLVIKEQWAAVSNMGVQCLAQGHLVEKCTYTDTSQ